MHSIVAQVAVYAKFQHYPSKWRLKMNRFLRVIAASACGLLALWVATAQGAAADEPNPLTAVDIVLEPDTAMVKHAEADNQRLLKEFPKGFALGKTHHPHISCL
jgi:hypothetical protein